MEKTNTFCVAVVIPTFIGRFLSTLEQYTDPNYDVVVVDNSIDGVWDQVRGRINCYIRPEYNLGFAKSQNIAIKLATTPFVTCANDDIEFIDRRWWSGVIETFRENADNIVAVNPESCHVPGWGYGITGTLRLLPSEPPYAAADYDFLLAGDFEDVQGLPLTFPRRKSGLTDAITTWCTTFDTQRMRQALDEERSRFGVVNPGDNYFDERFYPGGGEDYDLNARMYRLDRRMVATTKSWVYHRWSSSRDHAALMPAVVPSRVWNYLDDLWPPDQNGGHHMDLFGHWTAPDGTRKVFERDRMIATADYV